MFTGSRFLRVTLDNQKSAIEGLKHQNRTLLGGLSIQKLAWPKTAKGKKYSSLIVFLSSPEEANRVLENGFVESGEVKEATRFRVGGGLVQCFNCLSYGHIAKFCRNPERCGHCAGPHNTRVCSDTGTKRCHACLHLKKRDYEHKAWSTACSVRLLKKEELSALRDVTPRLYPVQAPMEARQVVSQAPKLTKKQASKAKQNQSAAAPQPQRSASAAPPPVLRQAVLPFALPRREVGEVSEEGRMVE